MYETSRQTNKARDGKGIALRKQSQQRKMKENASLQCLLAVPSMARAASLLVPYLGIFCFLPYHV